MVTLGLPGRCLVFLQHLKTFSRVLFQAALLLALSG